MRKSFVIVLCLLASAVSSSAQTFQSGYFLDGYSYGYRINPAIHDQRGFLGLGVGDAQVGMASQMPFSTFFQTLSNGEMVPFWDDSADDRKVMSSLKGQTRLDLDLHESVLALGFRGTNSYNTLELNVRGFASANAADGVIGFMLAHSGDDKNSVYDMSNSDLKIQSFYELAYGHSHQFGDKLSLGLRVKFLAGLESLNAETGRLYRDHGEIVPPCDGHMAVSYKNLGIPTAGESVEFLDVLEMEEFTPAPNGFGGSVDLGLTYEPVKGLVVSASVLDLGGVSWKNHIYGHIDPDPKDDIHFVQEGVKSTFESLPLTVTAGARYSIPHLSWLTPGVLYTHRSYNGMSTYTMKAGLTVSAKDWASINANFGSSTYGPTWGGAFRFRLGFISLHAGLEGFMNADENPFRTSAFAGLNLVFGKGREK